MVNVKKWVSVFSLFLVIFFTACQTESIKEEHSTSETITKATPLSSYIERIVMQKTSEDDVIDNTNCFVIKFPYVVTVNNVEIKINSAADYLLVRNNIDANANDNDIVSIHFPVTVVLNNYSERRLVDQMAFNSLVTECKNNSNNLGKINCLHINYPIVINIYNSTNQIASSTSIANNQALYNFMGNLDSTLFIAFSYPMTVSNTSGQTFTITSNTQLENVIKDVIDNCVENTKPLLDFRSILVTGSWKVAYCYEKIDKTSIYNGYTFVFKSNNSVEIAKSGIYYNGIWSTKVENGIMEFEIKIDSDPLKQLDRGWKVFQLNNSNLRLRDESGGVNETDYLYFVKN